MGGSGKAGQMQEAAASQMAQQTANMPQFQGPMINPQTGQQARGGGFLNRLSDLQRSVYESAPVKGIMDFRNRLESQRDELLGPYQGYGGPYQGYGGEPTYQPDFQSMLEPRSPYLPQSPSFDYLLAGLPDYRSY